MCRNYFKLLTKYFSFPRFSFIERISNFVTEEEKPAAMHGGDRRNLSPAILASNFLVSLLAAVSWRIPSFTSLYPTWIIAARAASFDPCVPRDLTVGPARKRVLEVVVLLPGIGTSSVHFRSGKKLRCREWLCAWYHKLDDISIYFTYVSFAYTR